MYQLLLGLYILVCFLLVVVILMQSGRGGGLVESFSAAETLFGGKTNIYMVRITMILGALFLGLALGLNYFVVQKSKSVMQRLFGRPSTANVNTVVPVTKSGPEVKGVLPVNQEEVSKNEVVEGRKSALPRKKDESSPTSKRAVSLPVNQTKEESPSGESK